MTAIGHIKLQFGNPGSPMKSPWWREVCAQISR